mmetsp:Transcript_51075/g.121341  ORF Transcript_51075/g.121341 Transcript_51075/m.121341 type:complete len:560 (+) Transcript_51075:121-1800(+)
MQQLRSRGMRQKTAATPMFLLLAWASIITSAGAASAVTLEAPGVQTDLHDADSSPASSNDDADDEAEGVLPTSGGTDDLVDHVVATLVQNHRELKEAAEGLLEIRDSAHNIEGELFGKVVDDEAVKRTSLVKQRLRDANEEARHEIASLKKQIEAVELRLREAELVSSAPYPDPLEDSDDLSPPAMLVQMQREAVRRAAQTPSPAFKQTVVAAAPSPAFLSPVAASTEAGSISSPSPAAPCDHSAGAPAHPATVVVPQAHMTALEEHLVEVHHYSVACHSKVKDLEKALRIYMSVEPKDNSTAVATMQQAQVTAAAGRQRLHAEEALLKDRIWRAEAATVASLGQLRTDYSGLKDLEWKLNAMANQTKEQIRDEEQKLDAFLQQVQDEQRGLRQDEEDKLNLEAQLKQIQELFTPVVFRAIMSENEALQAELDEELRMLNRLKVEEAESLSDENKAKAVEESERQAAQSATEAVEAAHADAEHQIAVAANQTAENRQRQMSYISEAKAAISRRCNAEWETYGAQMSAEVDRCQQVADQLAAARAQEAALMEIAKAASAC